jgi:hypothetical protein
MPVRRRVSQLYLSTMAPGGKYLKSAQRYSRYGAGADIRILESNHGLAGGCQCWLVQQWHPRNHAHKLKARENDRTLENCYDRQGNAMSGRWQSKKKEFIREGPDKAR